jgi:hypothetical protein
MDRDVSGMSPIDVVRAHLAAVTSGDVEAMAGDYAADAVIERAGEQYEGLPAIRAYFRTVPERLAGGRVEPGEVRSVGGRVEFDWRLVGGPGDGISGTDSCLVREGLIIHQVVRLDRDDF